MEKEKPVPNYLELSPWEEFSDDDHAIANFFRKKILKESNSTLAFYCVVLLTALMFMIFEAMLQQNLAGSLIFGVISVLLLALIYDLVHTNRLKRKQIDNRKFKTCQVLVSDISDKYNDKYCKVQDKEGHAFSEPVAYYSYFSMKENEGVLAVLPRLTKNQKDFIIVFPKSYLKMEREDNKK